MERPDDRRLRARGARAAGSSAAAEWLDAARVRPRSSSATRCGAPATGTLLRRYRDGDAAIDGYAEDYASLIWGLLELFQATATRRGSRGRASCRRSRTRASGTTPDGGWFSTTGRDPSVLLRLKEDYDGAEPSASSVSVLNLLTLGASRRRRRRAEEGGAHARPLRRRAPAAPARVIPMMLAGALDLARRRDRRSSSSATRSGARPLRAEAARHYLPFALHGAGDSRAIAQQRAVARVLPFIAAMQPAGRPRDGLRLPRLRLPRAGDHARRAGGAAAAA